MKYALLIGDGMGDFPMPELNGKTPLMSAPTPNLDLMAKKGLLGLARTVPEGMTPGSDVAIMSLMGYNPQGILTGRGPLEAASRRIDIAPDELAFRVNLVCVERLDGKVFMRDHSAGNISSLESAELVTALKEKLPLSEGRRLFPGVGYRHIMTWPKEKPDRFPSWAPHDLRNQDVAALLDEPSAKPIMDMVRASWPILEDHPVNKKRAAEGLPRANSIWLWGQGLKPAVKTYRERWGISGVTVSAVDLIKGLGLIAGLESIDVPGATGWLDTDYEGKVKAALKALEKVDFVVLHIEAPDEASHQGQLDSKLRAIGDFDAKVVGPMLRALPGFGNFRVLAACDHFTPLKIQTHTPDPVPFILYAQPGDGEIKPSGLTYNEANGAAAGIIVDPGAELGRLLFGPEKQP
ncbi:MAG: cofactor-independent phosphoglycerate mutase [Candidatus Adiutrix sp.]|nr:cofactor-independent phosphoglycerate mutase [Candidatus Adiutrix sp.]